MVNQIKPKRGEGYIDICVGVIAFVMVLVVAINIFSFITLRVEMDEIADELIEEATYTGAFSTEFTSRSNTLKTEYFSFSTETGADKYFNSTYKRVQLGDVMWVKISVQTYVKGLGVFKIPVTVSVKKTGLSEKYWK